MLAYPHTTLFFALHYDPHTTKYACGCLITCNLLVISQRLYLASGGGEEEEIGGGVHTIPFIYLITMMIDDRSKVRWQGVITLTLTGWGWLEVDTKVRDTKKIECNRVDSL